MQRAGADLRLVGLDRWVAYLQPLIALPIRERRALIDATTDLAQLPARVIRINEKARHSGRAFRALIFKTQNRNVVY